MLPAPLHSAHVLAHAEQVATPPMVSTNVALGHAATQLPLCRKGSAAPAQLTHSELLGPEHVPHVVWHGWHWSSPSAYLPLGVQEARHMPSPASKKGVAATQLVHWLAAGPVQVAHGAAQLSHVSAEAVPPPEQLKPASIVAQF